MQFLATYYWAGSYNSIDTFFIDESLNWDEAFSLIFTDLTPFTFLLLAIFTNVHFFLDNPTKLSFLDVMLLTEKVSLETTNNLYVFILRDLHNLLDNHFLIASHIFYLDYQNFVTLVTYHNPELALALNEYFLYNFYSTTTSHLPSVLFDTYTDSLNTTISEFLEHIFLLFVFVWIILLLVFNLRITKWEQASDPYLVRVYNYLFWISKEIRLQFDALIQAFFFIFLYTVLSIVTFDDDQEEGIELFNCFSFYFFLFTFFFYFFKYSIHFFSFLEPSKVEGKSVVWLLDQFRSDLFNTISLTMRFFVLMIRLNIYDGVDDILDSYYIFVADFEEDEYFIDLFFSVFTTMFFDYDTNDDRSFFLEDEPDFTADLFTIYFVLWGKFFFFLLFFLEILARTTLALYVTYLIIFEINAVNRSYSEDSFLLTKKIDFLTKPTNKERF